MFYALMGYLHAGITTGEAIRPRWRATSGGRGRSSTSA